MLFLLPALLQRGSSVAPARQGEVVRRVKCHFPVLAMAHLSGHPPLSLCLSLQVDLCCCDYVFSSPGCTPLAARSDRSQRALLGL